MAWVVQRPLGLFERASLWEVVGGGCGKHPKLPVAPQCQKRGKGCGIRLILECLREKEYNSRGRAACPEVCT